MKIVLLTSNSLRHKYIAAEISRQLDLKLTVTEAKPDNIQDTSTLKARDADFISAHFKARTRSEISFFEAYKEFPKQVELLEVPHGNINSKQVRTKIDEIAPDFIILFGTSIIAGPLLEKYSNRIINLHLGLSPYYKGSATNLFPYYYNEPECVGVTIHLATSKVDEGAVLHQLRPEIEPEDDLHTIGNKTILKAGKVLPEVLECYSEKKIVPQKQDPSGKICRNKDLSPAVLREIYVKFEDGLISNYIWDKERRDREKPIIEVGEVIG